MRRPRGAILGLIVLLLALAVAGSLGLRSLRIGAAQPRATLDRAGLPTGPVSYAEVNRHVEARLYYPFVGRYGEKQ